MRVGIMTGGGDSSEIKAVIWSAVRRAHHDGWEVISLWCRWAPVLEHHPANHGDGSRHRLHCRHPYPHLAHERPQDREPVAEGLRVLAQRSAKRLMPWPSGVSWGHLPPHVPVESVRQAKASGPDGGGGGDPSKRPKACTECTHTNRRRARP